MIREATPADGAALRALQRELPEPSPALLEYALSGPPLLLVAAAGAGPAGYLLAVLGDDAYVAELVVAPARRREGIGGALLDAAIERARDAGCAWVRVTVTPDNAAARALYADRGFAVAERLPGYFEGGDALLMRRRP